MKKEIEDHIRSLSDIALLEYVRAEPDSFTPEAVECAKNELSKRGITGDRLTQLEEQSKAQPQEEKKKMTGELVGIGGWLILPAISLVLDILFMPRPLISQLSQMRSECSVYLAALIVANAGLYIYVWVAAVRFFRTRSAAPRTMIRLQIAGVATAVVFFIISLALTEERDAQTIVMLLKENDFVIHGVIAAVWIEYFRVSKRVKATFVN